MNKWILKALTVLMLLALPAAGMAQALMLVDLPEGAQMVENVEFENGDFIQTYQLESGATVQLLRYAGFSMTLDELISSDWPFNCGVVLAEMTEISGYPAQHAHIAQAVDAQGYPVRADGKESGVIDVDLVIVNAGGQTLIYQYIAGGSADAQSAGALIDSLKVQGGEAAEVG